VGDCLLNATSVLVDAADIPVDNGMEFVLGKDWSVRVFLLLLTFRADMYIHAGKERSIPHLWAFMLLGQIVAISFAWNLFEIAVACSPIASQQSKSPPQSRNQAWRSILLALCLAVNFLCVYFIPYTVGTPQFLLTLGIPHLLLFIPLYVVDEGDMNRLGSYFSWIFFAAIVGLFAKATQEALAVPEGSRGFGRALFEHPAVSSVGWDILFCNINLAATVLVETW
jgi:hypothetical protein